jgi:Fe-S oxidoreductase
LPNLREALSRGGGVLLRNGVVLRRGVLLLCCGFGGAVGSPVELSNQLNSLEMRHFATSREVTSMERMFAAINCKKKEETTPFVIDDFF